MIYYRFMTLCGVLCMAAAGFLGAIYIFLLVVIEQFMSNSGLNYSLISLLVAVAICFIVRSLIKIKLIADVARYGYRTTAVILDVQYEDSVGASPYAESADELYKLCLQVTPHAGEQPFIVVIYQIFEDDAEKVLVKGKIIPVKYSIKTGLTLVTMDESVPWLSAKSFPFFRRLRRRVRS